MKISFFTFYYPPDLCAGSFRAVALTRALAKKLGANDELHVITTHPNRYASYCVEAEDVEVDGKITVYRIAVPNHQGGMLAQVRTFSVFAFSAFRLCKQLKPDFLIGTTSRLMTGVLTWLSARLQRRNYYIDLRDIFSETISDLFVRKSRLLSVVAKRVFVFLEKRMVNGAAGVNVVSGGFPEYFQAEGVDTSDWSFFPNGVDQEFMKFIPVVRDSSKRVRIVMYAGNIGHGQGLETVIPAVAKRLGDGYRFVVVGDGGALSLLREAIQREDVSNVELLPPVSRAELIEYYRDADILFLHLNDVPAFLRALPSKIFEYVALGKPIVAGLSGYSAQFMKAHAPYACLFEPGDFMEATSCIMAVTNFDVSDAVVSRFVRLYARSSIMDRMADSLIDVATRSQ